MSDANDDWHALMQGVRSGDNDACHDFWNQYGPSLERVAQRHLSSGMRRRVGPETVMLSACRTFFRRAQGGEFELPDSEALWRLLCAITVNKVRMKSRHHLRKKRGLDAEVHPETMPDVAGSSTPALDDLAFQEQLEVLIAKFDEEEAQVLDLKLQQYTNDEIAEQLECSERTVRRMMKRIQSQLGAIFDSDCENQASVRFTKALPDDQA